MAWAFGTVATAGGSSGTNLNSVSRPSSIATGDWQVLLLRLEVTGKTPAFSNGTWTLVRVDTVGSDFDEFLYVSRYNGEGSTFNITWDGTNLWRTAIIGRYTGGASGSTTDSADTDGTGHVDASGSPTTVNYDGFTPASNDDLIIYGESNFAGRANGAVSGTTPTLTERADFDGSALGDGIQTTATAIGNRTSTLAGGGAHNVGAIFAFTLTGGGTTLTPDPVTMPLVVPAPTLALTLAPSPVTMPLATPAPTVALVLSPAPVTMPLVVVQPTLVLGIAPAPVQMPLAIPAPTITLALNPAPVTMPLVIPAPTLDVGGSTTLTPAPVVMPLVVPAPQLALVLSPAPVTMPLVVVQPTLVLGISPAPVQMPLTVVGPTVVLVVSPGPVVMPLVVPTPVLVVGGLSAIVLTPAPVGIELRVLAAYIVLGILNYRDCAPDQALPDIVAWPPGVVRATGEETAAELRGCAVPTDTLMPWEI